MVLPSGLMPRLARDGTSVARSGSTLPRSSCFTRPLKIAPSMYPSWMRPLVTGFSVFGSAMIASLTIPWTVLELTALDKPPLVDTFEPPTRQLTRLHATATISDTRAPKWKKADDIAGFTSWFDWCIRVRPQFGERPG